MNFIERAARQAALPPLCTCGTALKVRGTEPLVLEPCPTCLDALKAAVAARIEAILELAEVPPKADDIEAQIAVRRQP